MKTIIKTLFIFLLILSLAPNLVNAQNNGKKISEMTKEEILRLSNDELLNLSIDDLVLLAEKVGVSVDELLDLSINSGAKGGFATQLEDLDIETYVHGYAAFWYRNFDLDRQKNNKSFDLHYFNPMFGINVKDKVIAELMLEYEHGGDEITIRYGILDYAFSKYATLRVGKFLMPIGRYNEYLYPEHINLFPDRPLSHWNIIPIVWSEVGAQLRGNIQINNKTSVNYAAYLVNGLEQKDGGYGGPIRDMRENILDYNSDNKALGGRIGFKPVTSTEVGFSYYSGAYSTDGKMNLSILCIDAEYQYKKFGIRGEYVKSEQDTLNGSITSDGFYTELSYRINKYLEPAVRYEQANLPGLIGLSDLNGDGIKDLNNDTFSRLSLGVIIYPEPELLSRFNFKVNYNIIPNDGQGKKRNEFVLQATIGF